MGVGKASIAINHHGPAAPLYLSYTSGTTGPPKGAILLSEPVTLGTSCIADRLQLTRHDVLLATTPISSSFQLVAALMPALHVGASVGLVAGSSTEVIWQIALEQQATILVAYPLTLADMVNTPQALAGKSPFRLALSGGSSLAPRIKRDYQEYLGISLLESYGQSELGGFMVLGAPHDDEQALAEGYAGRPLPDRLAYIGDSNGRELPTGEIGEVMVPHGFFHEYHRKPDQTAETKRDGVLHTGDLGISNKDGYIKVVGRLGEADNARQRGGFLREVEDSYYEHQAVQHAVVVEGANGIIEGFAELRAGQETAAEELQQFVTDRVAAGLAPRQTTILEKMPRTFSGKADRLTLSQRVGVSGD
jgi:acyl-coenzyme A synthetase/AMP-(fatty) acid ligase